jgi:hypothetical protein
MLSPETLDRYRGMTPGERLRLTLDLTAEATKSLLSGPEAIVDRRLELLRLQNDRRNRAMLEGILKTRSTSATDAGRVQRTS